MKKVEINTEYIKLDQFLKWAGIRDKWRRSKRRNNKWESKGERGNRNKKRKKAYKR